MRESAELPHRSGPVFQFEGERIKDCNTAAFQKAVARAGLNGPGLQPVNWLTLRHTWTAWAVQAGVPLLDVKELGGWRTMKTVLLYAHLAPDHLAASAARVSTVTKTGTDGST